MVVQDLVGLRQELRLVDDDEPNTLQRQTLFSVLVVQWPLFAVGQA
jgi:hypothetical protein